jgi:hypothetical protein
MPTRLTEQEIDRALAKIRSEYDHYIVHYLKPADVKYKFDERLAQALRERIDLTGFLGVEMQVVKTLLAKAAHSQAFPTPEAESKSKRSPPRMSYADRVLAQLRARIAPYPSLGIPEHPQRSIDVDKLYGTLRWFRGEIWNFLYPVLVKKANSAVLYRTDEELMALTGEGDHFPKEIMAYVEALVNDASLSLLSRAQNRCLLQGAQFLHRLRALLDGTLGLAEFSSGEAESLRRAVAFCDRVIADFRLRDLKAQV